MGNAASTAQNKEETVYTSVFTSDPVMVAAIDFGTSFSGYAFALRNNPKDIIINKDWGAEVGTSSVKTPTTLLTTAQGAFMSFGYKAEHDYAQLCQAGKKQDYNLFRNFKMILYYEKKLTRHTEIQAINGKKCKGMDIFAMAIRYLKKHLLEEVSKINSTVDDKLIQWVLTIPAIWNESAKQFMREAAFKAGLISNIHSKQLLLALEPEAASVYCRKVELNHFMHEVPKSMLELKFERGTKYMIIDMGGGTVDITVHLVNPDDTLTEVISASGGEWAGNAVDKNFENLMSNILSKRFIDKYKEVSPSQWLELVTQYEHKKRAINIIDNEGISLQMNWSIQQHYQDVTGKKIAQVIKDTTASGVTFSEGNIMLTPGTVQKELFEPVTDSIINHVDKLIREHKLQKLNYILLVGGFSDSSFLFHKIKKQFNETIPVLSPYSASLAIVKGAVMFGQKPHVISARVARKSYGIGVDDVFVPGKHKDFKKYTDDDGNVRSKDVFKSYVNKGDVINENTYKTYDLFVKPKGTEVMFSVYSSEKNGVIHVDDDSVTKIGTLSLTIPLDLTHQEIYISNKAYFGKSEVVIELEEKRGSSIQRANLTLDLLTD